MISARQFVLAAIMLFFLSSMASSPLQAADARAAQAPPPLAMEELEVRGSRDKPGPLFLPGPKPVFHYAPVHLGLFTEEMTKPVLPCGKNKNCGGADHGGTLEP